MSMSRFDAKLENHRAPVTLRAVRSERDEIQTKQNNLISHRKNNANDRNRKTNPQRNSTQQYHKTKNANPVKRISKQPRKLIGCMGQYPSKYSGTGDEKSNSDGESCIDEFELDKLEDQVDQFERNVRRFHQLKDSLNFHICFTFFVVIMITLVCLLFGENSILPLPKQDAFAKFFTIEYRWEYYYGSAVFNISQVIIAPAIRNPMADYQIYNLSKWWYG